MIGEGAEVHRRHVDHVAVKVEEAAVVAGADIPAELGVAVEVAANDAVRDAADRNAQAANSFDLPGFARGVPGGHSRRRVGRLVGGQRGSADLGRGSRNLDDKCNVLNRTMVIARCARIARIGDQQRSASGRQDPAENADSSRAGRNFDGRRPAFRREGGNGFGPLLLRVGPRAGRLRLGLCADHPAEPEPDSSVASAGETGHRGLFVAGRLGKRGIDLGSSPEFSLAKAGHLHMTRAPEARSLIAVRPPQPISLVFAPVGAALFPGDPDGSVGSAGDAGVRLVIGRCGDGNYRSGLPVANAG